MSNMCWDQCMVLPPWILGFRPDLGFLRLGCKNALNFLGKFLDFKNHFSAEGSPGMDTKSSLRIFKINLHPLPLRLQGGSLKVVSMNFHGEPIFRFSEMNFSFWRCFFVCSMYCLYPCSSDIATNEIYIPEILWISVFRYSVSILASAQIKCTYIGYELSVQPYRFKYVFIAYNWPQGCKAFFWKSTRLPNCSG